MLQWIEYKSKRLKKIAIIASAIFVAIFLFSGVMTAAAQTLGAPSTTAGQVAMEGLQVVQQPLGLASTDIRIIIGRIIRVALSLLGILLLCLILYAGYLWMTAGGNDEQITQAKKIIRNAVVGLAIILSAYAITLMVFKILGFDAISNVPAIEQPYYSNLTGSGALGRIVKDHYPVRDQRGVARNTKIVITFFHPIKLDTSWITKKAETGKPLGSCKNTITNYKDDCDQLNLSKLSIDVVKITRTKVGDQVTETETSIGDPTNPNSGAAILAAPVNGQVDTIVIRPNDNLGSPSEEVSYRVYIGPNIKWDDRGTPSIFAGFAEQQYFWNFTCNTTIDSVPPFVTNVFPSDSAVEYKNTEIQISFSEPIDPTGIQGEFIATSTGGHDYFYLPGSNVFLRISPDSGVFAAGEGFPSGTMKLTGNYRVLTFTPSAVCGVNACGAPIYCLPTPAGATSSFSFILKAAQTRAVTGDKNFESLPFTGFNDMASNALDSGPADGNGKVTRHDNIVQVAPSGEPVFFARANADNYWWTFKIIDDIDLTSPYLRQVTPGLDAGNVSATQTLGMVFSKRMRIEPLYGINVVEHPSADERCAGHPGCRAIPLWKVPGNIQFGAVPTGQSGRFATTSMEMMHGPFIKEILQYYLPELTSAVEDVGFNCFYPGLGPGGDSQTFNGTNIGTGGPDPSGICDDTKANCCEVIDSPVHSAYCCDGLVNKTGDPAHPFGNTTTCRTYIKSISPTQ